MSTEFFNDQWRIPSNDNQNKVSNYSMSFDGSSDYIDAGTGLGNSLGTYTGDASISLWFKADTTASNDGLFSITAFDDVVFGNLRINIYNNVLYFVSNSTGNYKTIPFTDTTSWHHLVCVFKSGDITNSKIYLDGVDQTTTDVGTFPSSLSLTGLKTIIGAYHSINQVFQGKMDQVTFFDYELSQDQVTQLGAEGYAFNFIPNDYIDLGTTTAYDTGDLSVAIWVKITDNGTTQYIFSNSGSPSILGFDIKVRGNNEIGIQRHNTTNGAGSGWISPGFVYDTWQHLAFTYEESTGTIKTFLNGNLVATDTGTSTATLVSEKLTIGSYKGVQNFINGELSNAQVFNTKLGDSEIATIYNNGKPLTDMSSFTSLQGWWKLDDTATFNSNWSIPDASSNSNTGTSVGMNASNLVASNINGELIANPMITSPKPIAYYQLGDQSVDNGANYLVPNNSLSDYVFDFDGTDDYIDLGSTDVLFDSTQGFSFSAWVKLNGYTNSQYPSIANIKTNLTTGWVVFLSQTSTPGNYAGLNFGSKTGFTRIKTDGNISQDFIGQWKHVCITFDGVSRTAISSYTAYIDGSPVALTNSYLFSSVPNVNTIGIGATSTNTFDGLISNVSTFNTELTSTQVETIYNNGAPNNISSLSPTAWYKLNASEIFNSKWSVDNNAYPSVYQSSLNFNGSSDYIDCGDSDDLSFGNSTTDSPFSISAWVYMDSNASFRIVNKYDAPNYEYQFDTGSSGQLRFFVLDGTGYRGRTGSTLNIGQWHHVVATYSGVGGTNAENGTKIYVNGANIVGSTSTFGSYTAMSNTIAPVYIGRIGTSYSNGRISNASIFNTELTSTQVTTLYNNGTPEASISHSPVSWWKLDNTTTGLIDNGSASNNGTNNGATEYAGFVNALGGESVGMDSSNLVVSDLQQTSGYSPYALDFDGADDYLDTPQINLGSTNTISFWINNSATNIGTIFGDPNAFGSPPYALVQDTSAGNLTFRLGNNDAGYWRLAVSSGLLSDGNWHHHCLSRNGVTINYYIDGTLQTNVTNNTLNASAGTNTTIEHIMANTTLASFASGKLSNVALWNTNLTSTQVTEVYNQGVPSNLNTFSGTAPVSWWQIGSNSSFNSNTWTCLDEIGTNNAVSGANMTNDDIVDGPGYSASGLGTSSIDIKGDAPYSTANGLSENMDVLDRTLDTPIRNTHSIQLDGIDDYINAGSASYLNGLSEFSISTWINLTTAADAKCIISDWNLNTSPFGHFSLRTIDTSGTNYALILYIKKDLSDAGSNAVKTSAILAENTWYNAVFTYNSGTVTFYINGSPVSSTVINTIASNLFNQDGILTIGNWPGVSQYWDGKIDEVAMFNSELSAPQVASIYNNGNPNNILPLNPVSWHRFESLTTNGGVVTTADSSGNGLTGTVENGASLSTVVP